MLPDPVLSEGLPGHDGLLVLALDGLQEGSVVTELGCDCQEWLLACHPVSLLSSLTPGQLCVVPGVGV